MAYEIDLSGRVALVTGASGGLGEQFAKTLARAGAAVVLASRRTDRLMALRAHIEAEGGDAHVVALDVTDPEPLPTAHPLWRHPQVQITPHIASMTQPLSAAAVVIDNLHRFHAGEPMTGLVDRARGY